MKNLKLGISTLALAVASTVFAQNSNSPWLIGVGSHGVNHVAAGGGALNVLQNAFSSNQLYTINNYTITPPLSKLTVARHLAGPLVLDWQTSVGNVDNKRFGLGKEFMLMTGLGLQLKLNRLWSESSFIDPYVRVGANYLRHDYTGVTFPITNQQTGEVIQEFSSNKSGSRADHFALSTGLGSNFWLTKNFGLGIQGDYVSTPIDKSSVANFWQASASILFRFGQSDRDKDGVLDKDDRCPDTPGLPEFQGCPDTDGDGIPDIDDQCPDVPGPIENQGCPWPDTDGDGVLDKDDACPTVPGPVENQGCPWPDTDGDGVLDKDDKCPTVPGPAENHGCPWTKVQLADKATGALKDILFNFDRATVRPESADKLDQAAEIVKSSNGGTFLITGHTDKRGNANYNLRLSKQRAAAVVAELEKRGVAENQLKSTGVGSRDAQVPANASDAERLQDRKVVVQAVDGAAWEALQKSDLPVVKKKTKVKRVITPVRRTTGKKRR